MPLVNEIVTPKGDQAIVAEDTGTTDGSGREIVIEVAKIHTGKQGVDGGPQTILNPQYVAYADSASVDPFGRVRVSQPLGLFASKLLFDNQPLIWDDQQVSGASTTSTYNANQSSVTLLATGNVAGRRLRQTFRSINYQPGKGQLVFMTGVIDTTGTGAVGLTRRIGLYNDNNGYFFQYAGSTLSVVIRTFTSGAPVDTVVAQAAWNVDDFDGTGDVGNPSGFLLDPTKIQIFVIDFQWLSAGRIRFGLNINGTLYYGHDFNIANLQALPSIQIPNLPLRYEIISDGTGAAATATMTQVCATVQSEGGSEDIGFPFAADNGATGLVTGANTLLYALLAIQLKAGRGSANIILDSLSVLSISVNALFKFVLILNPTVAGAALVFTGINNSSVQAAPGVTANTLTGGTILHSEYVATQHGGNVTTNPTQDLALGTNIAGVSDTLVLAVQPVPASAMTFFGSMNWREAD